MVERRPDLNGARPPSHEANLHLIEQINKYQETLTVARKSDADVKEKWAQWEGLVGILSGGTVSTSVGMAGGDKFINVVAGHLLQNALERYIPSSGISSMNGAQLPPSVRALRSALERLEDMHTERSRILADAKRTSEQDDLRPVIVQEATRLAHGGSGDVNPELFEDVFEKELKKYGRFVSELDDNQERQDELLADIRVSESEPYQCHTRINSLILQSNMEVFLQERKQDSRVKHRENKLQEMELAYWKWREVIGNCEEGSQVCRTIAPTRNSASLTTVSLYSVLHRLPDNSSKSARISPGVGVLAASRCWVII
jgi:programmed cell death 6-interacting protein